MIRSSGCMHICMVGEDRSLMLPGVPQDSGPCLDHHENVGMQIGRGVKIGGPRLFVGCRSV